MPQTVVYCTTDFEGWHRWKDAPPEVIFLRDWHRHKFVVRAHVHVTHDNRQVEFFILRRKVDEFLAAHYKGKHFEESCEQIATKVADALGKMGYTVSAVECNEDDENGAIYYT